MKLQFHSTRKGLRVKEPGIKSRIIAAPIVVRAFAFLEDERRYEAQIIFWDIDGNRVELFKPLSLLSKTKQMTDLLRDKGYPYPRDPGDQKLLHEYIATSEPKRRLKTTRRTGWKGTSFVLPGACYKGNESEAVLVPLSRVLTYPTKDGSLKKWKRQVAVPAAHSSRLVFSICFALAAPGLKLTDVESGGIHLTSSSSHGKSTTLKVAESVFGFSAHKKLITWDATVTGLEETVASRCDLFMGLDELARFAPNDIALASKARDVAYRLASEMPRIRSTGFGDNTVIEDWRILFLSSGEQGLSEIALAAGQKRHQGEEVRLIDLPADVHECNGIFETTPKGLSTITLAENITAAAQTNHGVAGRKYLRKLVSEIEGSTSALLSSMEEFMKVANVPQLGWEWRFAKRFALSYASGILAAKFKVVPWTKKIIREANLKCYFDARRAVLDFEGLMNSVSSEIRGKANNKSLIRDLRKNADNSSRPSVSDAEGFIKHDKHGTYVAVHRGILQKWIGERLPVDAVVNKLEQDGHLVISSRGIPTRQILIKGIEGKQRYICLKQSFLEL